MDYRYGSYPFHRAMQSTETARQQSMRRHERMNGQVNSEVRKMADRLVDAKSAAERVREQVQNLE